MSELKLLKTSEMGGLRFDGKQEALLFTSLILICEKVAARSSSSLGCLARVSLKTGKETELWTE